ncbi:MAG: hypothetical protein K6G65_09190, partial [Lachnospiraceae bacterium]|nr:hypothetical protein [Lachnospiraceae bacterium]
MTLFNYNEIFYKQDYIWHMGNVNILSSPGFEDYRVAGVTFKYHYFADLQIAIYKILFGYSARKLVYVSPAFIYPIIYAITMEGMSERFKNKCNLYMVRMLVFLTLTATTLCNGARILFYSWGHSLTNVNGMSMAYPLMFLLLTFLYEWCEGDKDYTQYAW